MMLICLAALRLSHHCQGVFWTGCQHMPGVISLACWPLKDVSPVQPSLQGPEGRGVVVMLDLMAGHFCCGDDELNTIYLSLLPLELHTSSWAGGILLDEKKSDNT